MSTEQYLQELQRIKLQEVMLNSQVSRFFVDPARGAGKTTLVAIEGKIRKVETKSPINPLILLLEDV